MQKRIRTFTFSVVFHLFSRCFNSFSSIMIRLSFLYPDQSPRDGLSFSRSCRRCGRCDGREEGRHPSWGIIYTYLLLLPTTKVRCNEISCFSCNNFTFLSLFRIECVFSNLSVSKPLNQTNNRSQDAPGCWQVKLLAGEKLPKGEVVVSYCSKRIKNILQTVGD